MTPPPQENCRLHAPNKQQSQPSEIPESNLHLYLDPLQDLTPSANSSDSTQEHISNSTESDEEQQTEQMHISPIRSATKKQTTITSKIHKFYWFTISYVTHKWPRNAFFFLVLAWVLILNY